MSDDKEIYLRIEIFDMAMNYGPTSLEIPLPEDVDPESYAKGAYAGVEAIFKHYGVKEIEGQINPFMPTEDD